MRSTRPRRIDARCPGREGRDADGGYIDAHRAGQPLRSADVRPERYLHTPLGRVPAARPRVPGPTPR